MKVTYEVTLCELCLGEVKRRNREVFNSVEEAIEFHRTQANGMYSWWDISVCYEVGEENGTT